MNLRQLAASLAALSMSCPGAGAIDLPLPRIGPAPEFALTAQDGRAVSLADLRGKVVVVDFIFTSCGDDCPVQTEKLASIQSRLGADFASRVFFVSISVDPQHDTPKALSDYASRHRARLDGWAFLTGRPDEVRRVARRYGVVGLRADDGAVTHNALTSVIDGSGTLRVQYLGTRYEPREMLTDIRSLLRERGVR